MELGPKLKSLIVTEPAAAAFTRSVCFRFAFDCGVSPVAVAACARPPWDPSAGVADGGCWAAGGAGGCGPGGCCCASGPAATAHRLSSAAAASAVDRHRLIALSYARGRRAVRSGLVRARLAVGRRRRIRHVRQHVGLVGQALAAAVALGALRSIVARALGLRPHAHGLALALGRDDRDVEVVLAL